MRKTEIKLWPRAGGLVVIAAGRHEEESAILDDVVLLKVGGIDATYEVGLTISEVRDVADALYKLAQPKPPWARSRDDDGEPEQTAAEVTA